MEELNKLLKLIEEGNEEKILAEKELTNAFNDLCKYELVEIKDEGICLTPDGHKALREGAAGVIRNKENEKEMEIGDLEEKNSKNKIFIKVGLVLLIFVLTLFWLLKFKE